MITLYSWTTPNGRKISIALEEMELSYEAVAIDITKGDQMRPEFLALNPNHKIPVVKMPDGEVIAESGAILLALAEHSGKFAPPAGTAQYREMMEWLMWQMSGLGPTLGQAHHFLKYNQGKSPYAEERFNTEAKRLYGILDQRLEGRETILDDLSIVDFAVWPWISRFEWHQVDITEFPNVLAYYKRLAARPAFQRGYQQPLDAGPIPMP